MSLQHSSTRRKWLTTCTSTALGLSLIAGCSDDVADDSANADGNGGTGGGSESGMSDWNMYGVDPQNTGYHPNAIGPQSEDVTVQTLLDTDRTIQSSPIIADDVLYVAADDRIYGIDISTEDVELEIKADVSPTAHPALVDGVLYVGTGDGMMAISDEEKLWEYSSGLSGISPVPFDESVIGTQNMILHKFDINGGDDTILHNLRGFPVGRPYSAVPAVDDGIAYFAGEHVLYAIDIEQGEIEWEFENIDGESMGESSPAVADGTVYIGGEDQRLYAIDADSGTKEWTIETDFIIQSSPSIANGTVYVGCGDVSRSKLKAIDICDNEVLWTGDVLGSAQSKPLIAGDIIYYCTYHSAFAFDAENGDVLWTIEDIEGYFSSPPIIHAGQMLVPENDGKIYSIK